MKYLVSFFAIAMVLAVFAPVSHADVFTADLSGLNESPPNASPGFGEATVTFDPFAHTMRVEVSFSSLLGTVTASHIHSATALPFTGTAGVATSTPTFTGFPSGVTSGSYDHTFDMTQATSYNPAFVTLNGGSVAAAETSLFNSMVAGTAYLNIHSTVVPGGEIRGFLHQSLPEPSTLGLLTGFSVFGAAIVVRRRRA